MFDWGTVKLAVFDVDGTLYRQRPLRWIMMQMLARDALGSLSITTLRVLTDYRHRRETFADGFVEDFDRQLVDAVAARHRLEPSTVEGIIAEWIERRPLPHLRKAMVAGAPAIFHAVRRNGRSIAILSDYPAVTKIAALGFHADHIIAARDVGVMKPSPRGLQAAMAAAGVGPEATVMIGDRDSRDGAAADAAGVRVLLRTDKPIAGRACFADFLDPLFVPLFDTVAVR